MKLQFFKELLSFLQFPQSFLITKNKYLTNFNL